MRAESVTSALFIGSGVFAAGNGRPWIGVVASLYGFVDMMYHECDSRYHPASSSCVAGLLYDSGALGFLSEYLHRLVFLYISTAFLFRNGLLQTIARSLLTFFVAVITANARLTEVETDGAIVGVYISIWLTSIAFRAQPSLRYGWLVSFLALYALAAVLHVVRRRVGSGSDRWFIAIEHSIYAANVAIVPLILRPK